MAPVDRPTSRRGTDPTPSRNGSAEREGTGGLGTGTGGLGTGTGSLGRRRSTSSTSSRKAVSFQHLQLISEAAGMLPLQQMEDSTDEVVPSNIVNGETSDSFDHINDHSNNGHGDHNDHNDSNGDDKEGTCAEENRYGG